VAASVEFLAAGLLLLNIKGNAMHCCWSQRGGALVIRRLCAALGSEAVLVELAGALDSEQDLGFASTMVQVSAGGSS
jgi:hypothetical protein